MKTIVLAGLIALGVGLAAPAASAAPISGAGHEANSSSLVEKAYYACRRVRVCDWRGGYRHCWYRRTCRHWY
jgi:hypothetical protein